MAGPDPAICVSASWHDMAARRPVREYRANVKTKKLCCGSHAARRHGGTFPAFLLRRTSMTLAANHQRRALLAVIAGGAAVVGIAVLTAGSLASTSRPRTD